VFDNTKRKWLKKFSEAEGIDSVALENNLTDFFELLADYQNTKSAAFKRMLGMQSRQCYIKEDVFEKILLEQSQSSVDGNDELLEPVIEHFSISPSVCEYGKDVILSWEVKNATDLYLKELPNLKLNEIHLLQIKNVTKDKEFTLVAVNRNGNNEKGTSMTSMIKINKQIDRKA
jgi:hypothetical protein